MHSPELEIILQSVRLDDPGAAVREADSVIRRNKIDWDQLLEIALVHGIRPQLENLLNRTGSAPVPGYVRENLGNANRENLLRQLRSISEFFRIKKSLDQQDIAVIPFKGFWLAEAMYGNIAGREAYDVDLFIDIRDLGRIKTLMQERGYVVTSSVSQLTEEYILNELCEYNFGRFEERTCIFHFEYHWGSSRPVFRMNISLGDLRSQIITGKLQDKKLQVFSPAANLLLVVMHHGGKEQYVELKQVLDIAHIIQKPEEIDWQWLKGEAGRYRIEKLLYTGILLANQVTGVGVPSEVEKEVSAGTVRRLVNGRIRMISMPVSGRGKFRFEMRGWLFHIRSRDGFRLKLHFVRHFIRKVLMPWLVPRRFHHLFYNKKARINTVGGNAV